MAPRAGPSADQGVVDPVDHAIGAGDVRLDDPGGDAARPAARARPVRVKAWRYMRIPPVWSAGRAR